MSEETRYCPKRLSNTTPETDNGVHDAETPSTAGYTLNVSITPECDTIQEIIYVYDGKN